MSKEITFDFATRDDCLDQMVPSDLRALVSERDTLQAENERLLAERDALKKLGRFVIEHKGECAEDSILHTAISDLSNNIPMPEPPEADNG